MGAGFDGQVKFPSMSKRKAAGLISEETFNTFTLPLAMLIRLASSQCMKDGYCSELCIQFTDSEKILFSGKRLSRFFGVNLVDHKT